MEPLSLAPFFRAVNRGTRLGQHAKVTQRGGRGEVRLLTKPAWLLGTSQHWQNVDGGHPRVPALGEKVCQLPQSLQGLLSSEPKSSAEGHEGGWVPNAWHLMPQRRCLQIPGTWERLCPQPDEVWPIQRFLLLSELTALQSIPFPLKQIRVDSSMLWHRFIQGSEGEVRSVVQGGPGMAEGQKRNLGRRRNRRGSEDGPEWDHRSWEGTELRRPCPVLDGAQNSSNVKNWERGCWIQQQGSLSCPWPQALQCGWKSGWRMRIKGEETLTVVLKGR